MLQSPVSVAVRPSASRTTSSCPYAGRISECSIHTPITGLLEAHTTITTTRIVFRVKIDKMLCCYPVFEQHTLRSQHEPGILATSPLALGCIQTYCSSGSHAFFKILHI